jgi:hypothetical protein
MKQIDNNFEDFFREQFEDFESAPNADSWQIIQERLQPKRRRIALWWWLPTGIAAVLLGFVCLKSFSNKENRTIQETVKIEKSIKKDTIVEPTTDANIYIDANEKKATLQEDMSVQNAKNEINNKAIKDLLPQKNNTHYEKTYIKNETTVYHDVPNIENSTPNTPTQEAIIEKDAIASKEKISIALLPTLWKQVLSGEEITVKIPPLTNNDKKNTLTAPQKKSNKMVSFSVDIAPTYNLRSILPNANDERYINNITIPAITSAQRIGLQIGGGIDFKLSKYFGISTLFGYQYTPFDVTYDLRKNETPNIDAFVINKGNTLNINSVTYDTERVTLSQNWQSINAAFALNFYSNEKNKWSAGIGSGKWIGKDKLSGSPFFTTLTYTHEFKKGLKIAPFFRYDLKNYTLNNNLLEIKPYQFGLKIQL